MKIKERSDKAKSEIKKERGGIEYLIKRLTTRFRFKEESMNKKLKKLVS